MLGHHVITRITVNAFGQGRAKTGNMGSTFPCIDVVDKGEQPFGLPIKILKADFYLYPILFSGNKNGFGVNTSPIAIEIFDVGDNTAIE